VLSAAPHRAARSERSRPRSSRLTSSSPILELEGKTIGIVTGIQGKRDARVEIDGEEIMPVSSPRVRMHALVSALDIVRALHEALWDREDIVRFTIGMFTVSPNAPSVVPARVVFSIDLRHPETARLRELGDAIPEICRNAGGRCEVSVKELSHDPPLEFPVSISDDRVVSTASAHTVWIFCRRRSRRALSALRARPA
jgi:N-carbamoyl-L-amino-acid hydrolase